MLLLICDEVFRRRYNAHVLNSLDCLRCCNTLDYWVWSEAFPIPTTSRHSAERAHCGSKYDIDAFASGLLPMRLPPFIHQILIPGCAHGDAGRKCRAMV